MTPRLPAALASALVLALLAPPASAQPVLAETPLATRHLCALHDYGDHVGPGPALDPSATEGARRGVRYNRVVSGGGAAATFQVDYSDNFTSEAQAAFQRAVDIWSTHLTSSVPIRVRADFEPLGANVLGQAGPTFIYALGDGVSFTWYPSALADALRGEDLASDPSGYDIVAEFSSAFQRFYFGLDGNPPSNKIDFVTVVLHELGHGLGFIGSGGVDDGSGQPRVHRRGEHRLRRDPGQRDGPVFPLVFDRFLTNGVFESILDTSTYPNNSFRLGDLFQSEDLLVDAPTVARIYGGLTPVWAPAAFEPGSSFSHWDEIVIRNSSAALMTPALANGEAYRDPGDITCAFFADMGWALGDGCSALSGSPPPSPRSSPPAWPSTWPAPTRRAALRRCVLRLPAPGDARVTLHDALGRELATLLDGPAQTDQTLALGAGVGLAPSAVPAWSRGRPGARSRGR